MTQHQNIISLQLLGDDSRQYGFVERQEIVLGRCLLLLACWTSRLFLELLQYFKQCADIIVRNLGQGRIDKTECVLSFIRVLIHEFELNDQQILF